MSEVIHDSHVELESLSRRYIEEQRALKQAKDSVESIKKDIQKILGDSRFVENPTLHRGSEGSGTEENDE